MTAFFEDSATTGFNSIPNEEAPDAGAVYLFEDVGGNWQESAYIKSSNANEGDQFGFGLLSGDGQTLVVGGQNEDSSSSGINSVPNDNGEADTSGAIYVFATRSSPVSLPVRALRYIPWTYPGGELH